MGEFKWVLTCPGAVYMVSLIATLLVSSTAGTGNQRWCPKVCSCYNEYQTVDCTNRGLTKFPPFSNLTEFLILDGNDFTSLPERAFQQTPNLLRLHIQNSKLKEMESTAFCGLEKLQELHLGHNQLTSFHGAGGEGCQLPDLKELVLSGNKLREIPRNLSSFVPNLEMLNLHNNQIVSARMDESFGGLRSLQNLDFSMNHFHEIEKEDFDPIRDVVALEILLISDCRLVRIDPLAFVGMNNLTTLHLTRTLESSLESIFKPFSAEDSRMANLVISEMLLPNLTSSMLGMFQRLVFLDASYSGVEFIDPRLFNRLHNLETLHLEGNSLKALDNIWALSRLRRLHLNDNHLSSIGFRKMTKLEVINLSQNKLKTIGSDWLSDSDNLVTVNLSDNQIDTISRRAFSQVSVNILDLSHNNLTSLGPMGTIKPHNLYVSHNQIYTVSSESFYRMSETLKEIDLTRNKLTKLPLDIFEELKLLRRLSLKHNDFGDSLQSGHLKDLFTSLYHLQELDLSHNNIHTLPSEQFSALHHLSILYLQGNHISDLASLSLHDLPSLAKLVISNNELATIQTDVLSQLNRLEVLDLSSNPYECTCNIAPFLSWLRTTPVIILGNKNHSKYSCSFPPALSGQFLFSYFPEPGECPDAEQSPRDHSLLEHQRLTILGIVVGCVLVTAGILGLVLYFGHVCQHIKSLHYRWQVRYREVSGVEIAGDPKA